MKSRFQVLLPHAVGPLYALMFTMLLELIDRNAPHVTPSLALAFISLAISFVFAGLRASLITATIIVAYGLIEFDFDVYRLGQTALAAYSIAVVNGWGKRLLLKMYQEAEYYRLKAIDTYNGNRAKAVEVLDNLDKALEAKDMVEIKKLVQVARIKQADTLTLTGSWREIAKDKRLAIEALEESAGYPWRADEKIKSIDLVVHEILKEVYRIRRAMEGEPKTD